MAGRFLQIGVPVNGFDQFVKVTRDFSCNMTTVTGYCVDIFDAVVEALPYAMTCQYITFAKPDGKFAGSYSDLVYQVYFKVKLIFSHLFSIHRNTMLCPTILASYLYIMHHTLHCNRSMMAWSEIQLLLQDRKSTRLNSSHPSISRMPSSA